MKTIKICDEIKSEIDNYGAFRVTACTPTKVKKNIANLLKHNGVYISERTHSYVEFKKNWI